MIELLTPDEMAECDRLTIAGGIPGIALMEKAGRAVADAVARHPLGTRVVVVAGPGNNGGDGFIAARVLAERGYPGAHAAPWRRGGAARRCRGGRAALGAADRTGGAECDWRRGRHHRCVIWSRPQSTGARRGARPHRGDECKRFAHRRHRPAERHQRRERCDHGRCGQGIAKASPSSAASQATSCCLEGCTPERCALRISAFQKAYWNACGRRRSRTVLRCGARAFPIPRLDGHKYSRGHAVVVSGDLSFTGAARLAARGALRAGAGLVTLASPRAALPVNAAASLAVMVRAADGPDELRALLADKRLNAVVLGPGLGVGAATRALVEAALDGERAVVLDADALTSFADNPDALFAAISSRTRPVVLTPHQGEFSRLFNGIPQTSGETSKLALARLAAQSLRRDCPAQRAGHRHRRRLTAEPPSTRTRRHGLRPRGRATCWRE